MLKQYIGFGKWSKFYNYILFLVIASVIGDISIGNCKKLNNNGIIRNLYKYFKNILFGSIFLAIFKIGLNKLNRNKDSIEKTKRPKNSKDTTLIFNDKRYAFAMGNIDVIFLLIISLIYVVISEIGNILNFFDLYSLDLWIVDIFFILILMYNYFPQ